MSQQDEINDMLRAWEEQGLILRELVMAPLTMATFLREMAPRPRYLVSNPMPVAHAMYMGILIRESRMVPEGRAWPMLERDCPPVLPLPVVVPFSDAEYAPWSRQR